MKKLLKLSAFAMAALIVFTGCEDESSAEPAEEFVSVFATDNSATQGFRGEIVTLEFNVRSSSPITAASVNGIPVQFSEAADQNISFDFTIPENDEVGSTYDFTFSFTNAEGTTTEETSVELVAGPALEESAEAPLVTMKPAFSSVNVETLISSNDVLDTYNGGSFQLGGSADGMGMVENADGNFELLVNCEDHYSVVRLTLDRNLRPLKGDYMLNSSVADFARQCSGTMWESAIHGGNRDVYISSSETFNYVSRGIDPYQVIPTPSDLQHIKAFGQFAWENNVPLPQNAYPGKTVVIGGDDDSSFSEGQIALYYSENGDQDLENGSIYVLKLEGATTPSNEGDLDFGVDYEVEFVEIPNGANLSKDEMEQASVDANSLQFMRVEDLDYGKGSDADSRIVYFAVTGRGPGRGTYNDWGTGYRLVLDEDNPLRGTLRQILSGNTDTNKMDGNLATLQSPDNIVVTENYIYWQEDPNSFSRGHTAYIYQQSISDLTQINEFLEFVVRGSLGGNEGALDSNSGEYGAMIDVSEKVGEEGTFILALQPHYWRDEQFSGIDGHDLGIPPGFPGEDNQGSQVVILRNVPR
jgi:hypothetical protein